MSYTIEVTRDDLCFVNAVQKEKKYGYGLENIRIRLINNKIQFEATDNNIMVQASFDIIQSPLNDVIVSKELMISPEFFRKLTYQCKQKELIVLVIDFENKVVSGSSIFCTVSINHISSATTLDTEIHLKDSDTTLTINKKYLEKLLSSLPANTPYVKINLREDDNIQHIKILSVNTPHESNTDYSYIVGYVEKKK